MRASFLLVPVGFSLLFFYACGDDGTPALAGSPDVDASMDASQRTTDASGSSDSSTNDASVDAAKDAAADSGDGGVVTDASPESSIPTAFSLFDESPGENTYGGLDATHWVASGTVIDASAGTQWFGLSNPNINSRINLSIKKELGGVVQDQPYTVSFYVAKNETSYGALLRSDFAKLRIGGLVGDVTWTSTPLPPTIKGGWVQWVGTYTPDPADVGGPFYFEASFDLPGMSTVSFDGPVRAVP